MCPRNLYRTRPLIARKWAKRQGAKAAKRPVAEVVHHLQLIISYDW